VDKSLSIGMALIGTGAETMRPNTVTLAAPSARRAAARASGSPDATVSMTTDPPAMGAIVLLDWKAGAVAPCPLVCCKCASYSACKASRSGPTLAMAAFEGEVPIPRFSTPRSWVAGDLAAWAERGGAVEPRPHAAAPSARCRKGRKRVSLRVFIMNLRFERFCLTYPSGTAVMVFYADGATLGGVRVTHPLAVVEVIEVSRLSVGIPELGRP
jgi:hypothetical protein